MPPVFKPANTRQGVHISQTPSAHGLADADFYIGDEAGPACPVH